MKKRLSIPVIVILLGTAAIGQDVPTGEVFLGFTYSRMNSATNVPAFSSNGAGGQFVLNFGRWFGAVADVGAVHNGNIGGNHLDTTLTNFLIGPRIYIRKHSRVTPFFQTLFGGVYGSTSVATTLPEGTPIPTPYSSNLANAVAIRASSSQTAFAMVAGGGLDIKINRFLSFRPIGLDYYLTRLQNLRSANDNNQHNLRYTTGFSFTFGGEAPSPPPPPPAALQSCWDGSSVPAGEPCPKRNLSLALQASQTELCPGTSIQISLAAKVPADATYQWTIEGQATSQAESLEFGATGREPGAYKVGLSVTAPDYNEATAATTITVLPYRPPSVVLEVSPPEIWAGEQATVTARLNPGLCGGAVRPPVFTVSEGTMREDRFDSTGVQFDPAEGSEQRKSVKILAKVSDERSTVDGEAAVIVKQRAAAAKRLPDIVFPQGQARVNNCGKRVLLEELRPYTSSSPGGKVVLVGHLAENESGSADLDQRRALNAAAVISAGRGVCQNFPAAQILIGAAGAEDNGVDYQSYFCGTSTVTRTEELAGQSVKQSDDNAKFRRVEVWFVPAGGSLPPSLKDYKDAASLSIASLGCPR